MSDAPRDNRSELISKAKELLVESTNISDSPDEMAVIDNVLFRCWQMGWLNALDNHRVKVSRLRRALDAMNGMVWVLLQVCERNGMSQTEANGFTNYYLAYKKAMEVDE